MGIITLKRAGIVVALCSILGSSSCATKNISNEQPQKECTVNISYKMIEGLSSVLSSCDKFLHVRPLYSDTKQIYDKIIGEGPIKLKLETAKGKIKNGNRQHLLYFKAVNYSELPLSLVYRFEKDAESEFGKESFEIELEGILHAKMAHLDLPDGAEGDDFALNQIVETSSMIIEQAEMAYAADMYQRDGQVDDFGADFCLFPIANPAKPPYDRFCVSCDDDKEKIEDFIKTKKEEFLKLEKQLGIDKLKKGWEE